MERNQLDPDFLIKADKRTTDYPGILLLVVLWAICFYAFFSLPDVIPIHFNAKGETDGYGSKGFLWLLPLIGTVTYFGLSILSRYPQYFNYPVEITDENRDRQYRNAVELLRNLSLIVLALFTMISFIVYLTGSGIVKSPGAWLLPLVLAAVFIPTGWAIVRALRRMK